MTVYPDMHQAIRLYLDKSTSLTGSVDFLPEELNFWLNEAQDRFIKQRLYGNNYKQQKLDDSQKRIDDLRTLIVTSDFQSLSNSSLGINVKYTYLPDVNTGAPYMFYLNSEVYSVVSNSPIYSNTLQTGENITIELLSNYIKDSVNNPYIRRPLTYFYLEGGVPALAFIYGEEFIPVSCRITYIKRPKKLVSGTPGTYETNTCELAEHTHNEIVVMAADMLVENIESQRVQTFPQFNTSKSE
jgi:hypothetical protein